MLKVDFRFSTEINCCSDDFDYFIHAETIVEDFDFDYSNQLLGVEKARFFKNNKSAPIGFAGSGLFSAPFMFLGIILDKLTTMFTLKSSIVSYKLLIYSFSAISYLFFSFNYILKTLKLLELNYQKLDVAILILGVGISYYAFERYSMTHVYEGFSLTMLIYYSVKFFKHKDFKSTILIPAMMILGFSVKWVHVYLFFIPLVIKYLFFEKNKFELYKNKTFLISGIIFTSAFLYINKLIYGIYTINPSYIYISDTNENVKVEELVNFWESPFELIVTFVKRFFIILFTQEFGLFWFSPILFIGTIFSLIALIKSIKMGKSSKIGSIILCLCIGQVFFITILWKSPGSAYGFRYIFNLYPLLIIFYYYFLDKFEFKFIHKFLMLMSIFSFFSTLFFESTSLTQLSLEKELNSFGIMSQFTQRHYLEGYIYSFKELDSYLKLFTTSFFGAIILKLLIYFLGAETLLLLMSNFGLPTSNQKFILLIDNLEQIEFHYFLIVIIFAYVIFRLFKKNFNY